jgi:hypothetical protein
MLVRFMVPNDASCRGTRSAVADHMARNAANNGTFDAPLGICRSIRTDDD